MTEKRQLVLIVNDEKVNREILRHVLIDDFDILEAVNGQDAIEKLKENAKAVSMVILDLVMPVMDGFGFLEVYHATPEWVNVPVLVATAQTDSVIEQKCLALGAWDFVGKPYNLPILKLRISSAYARSQLGAMKSLQKANEQLIYINQHDMLTGLPNRQKFMADCNMMFHEHPDMKFAMVRFDVENFRLINSTFSMDGGNTFLKFIATMLVDMGKDRELFCYAHFNADIFVICSKYEHQEDVIAAIDRAKIVLKGYPIDFNIRPVFGVYLVENPLEADPDDVYDKVSLASRECKRTHLYDVNYAFYQDPLRDNLRRAQEFANDFPKAIAEEQFLVYLQPKYELVTNTISGSEALVRWKHPDKGMISPGAFIPVFEKNGFIMKLDYYMWEHVCMLLQQWLKEGKNPKPISVNVSRMDVYNKDLVDQIISLVEKYQIPPELFQLELTESAYTENQTVITNAMERLQERGFSILMDDFGSGYSSLNVLKDIPIDILKIDLKFLEKSNDTDKARFIMDSIIRMSRGLGIPVVAEGVEDERQARFLRSIGCEYVQGYLFAKPMPVVDFEQLAFRSDTKQSVENGKQSAEVIIEADDWTYLVNKFNRQFTNSGEAMVLYSYDGKKIRYRQVNKAFEDLFGLKGSMAMGDDPISHVSPCSLASVYEVFSKLSPKNSLCSCDLRSTIQKDDGPWLSLDLLFVRKIGDQEAILGYVSNIMTRKTILLTMKDFGNEARADVPKNGVLLIISNKHEFTRHLRDILESDYRVFDVPSGESGLRFIREACKPVDCILLDVSAMGINGEAFVTHLRNESRFSRLPVLLIGDNHEVEAVGSVSEADAIIAKVKKILSE